MENGNGNGEKTKVINYFKKLSGFGKVQTVRDFAQSFIIMDEIMKAAKEEQEKIINSLVESGAQLDEPFPEIKKRVKFKPGKEKTVIPTSDVYSKMQDSHSLEEFLKVVKIVEASLKELKGGEKIIAATKIHLKEKGNDSAGIYKMSKKEIKEVLEHDEFMKTPLKDLKR